MNRRFLPGFCLALALAAGVTPAAADPSCTDEGQKLLQAQAAKIVSISEYAQAHPEEPAGRSDPKCAMMQSVLDVLVQYNKISLDKRYCTVDEATIAEFNQKIDAQVKELVAGVPVCELHDPR